MQYISKCPECDGVDITGGFCDDCGTDLNPTDPIEFFEEEDDDEEDGNCDDWVYAEDED